MTSLTSELWPSIKSAMRAPWRNIRLQSSPVVASVPQILPAQQTASTEAPIAKSNVSIIWLPLFDHPLTLTVTFNTGAARLLSISAHGHSQTSTPGSGHPHRPIINKGNHPYVASASLFPWICAYRYSLLQDPSIRQSTLFRDLIHVPDNPVLLNTTTLSLHKRLQTTKVQLAQYLSPTESCCGELFPGSACAFGTNGQQQSYKSIGPECVILSATTC